MCRETARVLLLVLLATLVACGGDDPGSEVAQDPIDEVAADPGPQPDVAEPEPEAAEPAPDDAEPAPDVLEATPDLVEANEIEVDEVDEVESDVATEVLVPVCEGSWAPVTHDTTIDPSFLRGPFLQDVQGDGAVIAWRLAPPAEGEPEAPPEPGCVRYVVDGAEAEVCDDPDDNRQYAVRLTGLPPAAEVTYRAIVGDVETADLRFFAAPADDAPVRLLVFSDAHVNAETLPQLAAYGLADQVDYAVSVGDHVNSALVEEFDAYFALPQAALPPRALVADPRQPRGPRRRVLRQHRGTGRRPEPRQRGLLRRARGLGLVRLARAEGPHHLGRVEEGRRRGRLVTR